MPIVQCPHCSTSLNLKQAPASGKVKCPKCSGIVPVGTAAAGAAKRPARPAPTSRTIDPDDDRFDFGRINFPSASGTTAVSHFPAPEGLTAYEGPIPGDPLEMLAKKEAEESDLGDAMITPAAPKKSPKVLIGVLAGAAVLLIAGIVGVVMFSGGGGGPKVDVVAEAMKSAPEGYTAHGIQGVVCLLPSGDDFNKLPSMIECVAVKSSQTGTDFFFGAMNGGKREIDAEQMRKKAGRQLGGEILGKIETKRNGYSGIKGILDGSIFLPRMQVEIYHVDQRFVVIGTATPAFVTGIPSRSPLEKEEQEIFFKSLKVGPMPGWW